jgi:hypothetical protein
MRASSHCTTFYYYYRIPYIRKHWISHVSILLMVSAQKKEVLAYFFLADLRKTIRTQYDSLLSQVVEAP